MDDWNIRRIVEQLEDNIEDTKIIFELHQIPKDDDTDETKFSIKMNKEGAVNFAHDLLDSILCEGYNYECLSKYVDTEMNSKFVINNIEFINEDTDSEVATVYKETHKDRIGGYIVLSILIGIVVCFLWGFISIIIAITKLIF